MARALGVHTAELDHTTLDDHGSFVSAFSNRWLYRLDLSGNQTIKPISMLDVELPALGKPDLATEDVDRLQAVQMATDLAAALGVAKAADLRKTTCKKETVLLERCGTGRVDRRRGRCLVRLSTLDAITYFQVIFNDHLKPVRVDTNIRTKPVESAIRLLQQRSESAKEMPPALPDTSATTLFGTFFDTSEIRFEGNAYAFEGADFLNPMIAENPYKRSIFDDRNEGLFLQADFETYHGTADFRFWSYYWWNLYGRVGAARGNFDANSRRWQKPNVHIAHHRLSDYSLVGFNPNAFRPLELADHQTHQVPHAYSIYPEDRFYDDLESCTAAVFLTHGGPIQGRLQLRRNLDVWFIARNPGAKFGHGNLRHLFFCSCSTMGCFKSAPASQNDRDASLLSEWLPGGYISGLRTACGIDGDFNANDRGGWRFFGYYNKGDSISDAWAMGMIDECDTNAPVTVSYGATPEEALGTLYKGRFSPDRARPTWATASVWGVL